MSLLGFDAIGRSALGTLARSTNTNTIFRGDVGTYALVGQSAAFKSVAASNSSSFAWSGIGAGFAMDLSATRGNYSSSGGAAAFRPVMWTVVGTLGLAGRPALATARFLSLGYGYSVLAPAAPSIVSMSVQLGPYAVSGFDVSFGRGFENWFPLPQDGDVWVARAGPASDWRAPSAPVDGWVLEPKPEISWMPLSGQLGDWTAR